MSQYHQHDMIWNVDDSPEPMRTRFHKRFTDSLDQLMVISQAPDQEKVKNKEQRRKKEKEKYKIVFPEDAVWPFDRRPAPVLCG